MSHPVPPPVTLERPPTQTPPVRSLRAWLAAFCVMALLAAYAIGWFGYSYTRTSSVYYQMTGGQTVEKGGNLYRLDSLTATKVLASKYEPTQAANGEVYIVALLTVGHFNNDYVECDLDLVAVDRRTWKYESNVYSRPNDRACFDVKKGQTKQVEIVYRVPESATDDLAGLAFAHFLSLRKTIVLTPAS